MRWSMSRRFSQRDQSMPDRHHPPTHPLSDPSPPKAVLFDMDGTLTVPMLDFDAIRAEMGVSGPILEAMRGLDAEQLSAAADVLDRHERLAAERSELNDGCREVLAWLYERRVPTALVTRNSRASVRTVLDRHGLRFDLLVSREDGPPKPHPEPVSRCCRAFGLSAAEAWMVGDGSHDVEAGNAAGTPTVWVSHGRMRAFEAQPWREVDDLHGVLALLTSARR